MIDKNVLDVLNVCLYSKHSAVKIKWIKGNTHNGSGVIAFGEVIFGEISEKEGAVQISFGKNIFLDKVTRIVRMNYHNISLAEKGKKIGIYLSEMTFSKSQELAELQSQEV